MSALYPDSEALTARQRTVLNLYLVSTLMLFIMLMGFGLAMRLAQGAWIAIPPNIFYQIMTAHGAGMVGTVGLASSAVMWFFLRKYVRLSLPMFVANYAFFMLGAALLLEGRPEESVGPLAEGLRLFQELGFVARIGSALMALGMARATLGEPARGARAGASLLACP